MAIIAINVDCIDNLFSNPRFGGNLQPTDYILLLSKCPQPHRFLSSLIVCTHIWVFVNFEYVIRGTSA